MEKVVGKILKQYGSPVTLERGSDSWEVRAFFQPVRSKSWRYLEGDYSPLGEVPRGQYVYIGPAEPMAEAGDTVTVGGRKYQLRRTEAILYEDKVVYCWGLGIEKGGEDQWGQS